MNASAITRGFLQLLGQLQRRASVPFRCREVASEQPGVPEVLLDPCPQREIVPRLAPSSLEHGPGPRHPSVSARPIPRSSRTRPRAGPAIERSTACSRTLRPSEVSPHS